MVTGAGLPKRQIPFDVLQLQLRQTLEWRNLPTPGSKGCLMLLVDERIGSRDLLIALQNQGVPAELAHLDSGDIAFIGRGIADRQIFVGIELKRTTDLISSLRSGRFQGFQLEKIVNTYDRGWFISEGEWREGYGGVLEVLTIDGWERASAGPHGIMMSDLESWIITQTIRGGLGYRHCSHREDTIRFIAVLYAWWTEKALDEHRGHEAIYLSPPDRATFIEPSTERKMISCIPKVGWEKSAALETHFGGIRGLLAASEKEVIEVEGIGKTIAANVKAIK